MSDENLSQEEIDAMLKAAGDGEAAGSEPGTEPETGDALSTVEELLTPDQLDVLGEFYNIAMGKAATVLSSILDKQVEITTPQVTLEKWTDMAKKHPVPSLMVVIEYMQGLQGSNLLVIDRRDANVIANIMDEAGTDLEEPLDEYRQGIVGEAMNQMLGGAVVSISEMLGREVTISPPTIFCLDFADSAARVQNPLADEQLVQIAFVFRVKELVESTMLQLMTVDFARQLADEVIAGEEEEVVVRPAVEREGEGRDADEGQLEGSEPPIQVKKAEFMPLDGGDGHGAGDENLDIIMDIEIEVSVELGRTYMKIKDVLALGEGSVIELDKLVGEPMEIYANDKLIARGEVVVIDEDFGIRITEIVKNRNLTGSMK